MLERLLAGILLLVLSSSLGLLPSAEYHQEYGKLSVA